MTTTKDTNVSRFDSRALYDTYTVTIQLRERIYGGTPKRGDMIKIWVETRTGYSDEKTVEQTKEAMDLLVDETAEKSWTGFQGDENGLFISANNLKAMIKQGASMLGITKKKMGSKQILAEGTEVKSVSGVNGRRSTRIYLDKGTPDGFEERPIHVMTAQGPRTALKRIDYIENARLTFEIWILRTAAQEKRHIGEDELVQILTFSQENGVGADRSQGAGKFDVVEFQRLS